MMINALHYTIEASLIIAFFYGIYFFLLKDKTSFKFNRFFLLSGLMASLVFPLISFGFGMDYVEQANPNTAQMLEGMSIGEVTPTPTVGVLNLMTWIYICGVLLLLSLFIYNLCKIVVVIIRGEKSKENGYTLVEVKDLMTTASFLGFVFWNEEEGNDPQNNALVLEHELAHVQQKHTIDRLLVDLYLAFFWFNPFVWWVKKAIIENHEYLADDAVAENQNRKKYTSFLACQTLAFSGLPISRFKSKALLKRVGMLKKESISNNKTSIVFSLLSIMAVLIISAFDFKSVPTSEDKKESAAELFKDNKVYSIVEESAFPEGGMSTFYTLFKQRINYPEEAKQLEIEGKVFVEFIINQRGKITAIKTIKGIGHGCDKEAERVLRSMPNWNPGILRGRPVKQRLILPITFKLAKHR